MADTNLKLNALRDKATQNDALRKRLIETKNQKEPLEAFCAEAEKAGISLSIGEILQMGEEYSDNQCKSTNGGNPYPYDYFDDAYEMFIASLEG